MYGKTEKAHHLDQLCHESLNVRKTGKAQHLELWHGSLKWKKKKKKEGGGVGETREKLVIIYLVKYMHGCFCFCFGSFNNY